VGAVLALPFAVLVTGFATLLGSRNRDLELPKTPQRSLAVLRTNPATLFYQCRSSVHRRQALSSLHFMAAEDFLSLTKLSLSRGAMKVNSAGIPLA
jgi:hypothetical protein